MKTAVSIPTPLYDAAEAAAADLGLSRSAFYARALRRYLARYRQLGVTKRLNAVYEEAAGSADRGLLAAQRKRLKRDAGSAGW